MKPNTMLRSTVATLTVCFAVVPFANAQLSSAPRSDFGMLRHDANKDGQLTLNEFTTALQTQFAIQDADGNGVITGQERETAREARRKAMKTAHFSALDTNGDGAISQPEFEAQPQKAGPRRANMQHFRGQRGPNRGVRPEQTDISYAEFSERALARFSIVDADSNNVITQEELHAAASVPRAGRR